MIVILDSADLHIEGTENGDTGCGLQRLFHASGAIFEHGQARKTVADDDFSLGRSAAKFVDN